MTPWKRWLFLLAILTIAPLAVACGAAGEPAPEPEPAAEEPASDEPEPDEPEPEPMPADEPAEDPEPDAPQLEGSINITNDDFEWGETTTETAEYVWSATVTNDTTATLDITVRFTFYDEADEVIRTETATVRIAPAQSERVSGTGTFVWDDANRIDSHTATYDFEIVDGT